MRELVCLFFMTEFPDEGFLRASKAFRAYGVVKLKYFGVLTNYWLVFSFFLIDHLLIDDIVECAFKGYNQYLNLYTRTDF